MQARSRYSVWWLTSDGSSGGAKLGERSRNRRFAASIPKQARARERLERILDAARRELERGPEAEITIESIAERAGVGVGSVYSYFSSQTALLLAVAATVMDEADSEAARQFAACLELPWRDAVSRTLDATLGVFRDASEYEKLLRTIRFTPEFAAVTTASNDRVADMMAMHPEFDRNGTRRARRYRSAARW